MTTVVSPKASHNEAVELSADVLVLGGGPAGCWAAWSALEAGANVILIDKGYVGTSGATAAGNSSIIYTAPDSAARHKAVRQRVERGLGLVDADLVDQVLSEVYVNLNRLADWGYPFPNRDDGTSYRSSMRGVDYLRFMRLKLIKAGATIIDQAPALSLLMADGVVAGAKGQFRRGGPDWTVKAGATVLATGGCAFLSGALGTRNLTGDGYLMGAEAGAGFSGMDFTGQYGIAPVGCSVTKGIVYHWASFFSEDGSPIKAEGDRQDVIAQGMKQGRVFARLDKADARVQAGMRGQANVFAPFDRLGIDPFTEKFEVTLLYEGTVRGNGGLLTGRDGATEVPGLFAAGDAAARDRMSGATSGGGGPNASFALATGVWSGRAAAYFAQQIGRSTETRRLHQAAPEPAAHQGDSAHLADAITQSIVPLDRNFYRSRAGLGTATAEVDAARRELVRGVAPDQNLRQREAQGLAATASWILASARARTSACGLHRLIDGDAAQAPYLVRTRGIAETATNTVPLAMSGVVR